MIPECGAAKRSKDTGLDRFAQTRPTETVQRTINMLQWDWKPENKSIQCDHTSLVLAQPELKTSDLEIARTNR